MRSCFLAICWYEEEPEFVTIDQNFSVVKIMKSRFWFSDFIIKIIFGDNLQILFSYKEENHYLFVKLTSFVKNLELKLAKVKERL